MSMSFSLLSYSTLWVLSLTAALLLTQVVSQETVTLDLTSSVSEALTTELPSPLPCVNGVFSNGSCVCIPGWAGELCDTCTGGRIK